MLTRPLDGATARAVAPRGGPTIGLVCQLALLAGLALAPGLHVAGWLTGVGFGLAVWTSLRVGLGRAGQASLGPADRITLGRSVLVGGVAALAADSVSHDVPVALLVSLAGVALVLDAVDGRVARQTRTSSPMGARFDMEVDAFLILVLCVALVRPIGAWVLAIGAMRYVFVVAGRLLPWLNAPLPPRFSRKVVAAVQGIVLVVVAADVLAPALAVAALLTALGLLVWSFGQDTIWLARARRRGSAGLGLPDRTDDGLPPEPGAHEHDGQEQAQPGSTPG